MYALEALYLLSNRQGIIEERLQMRAGIHLASLLGNAQKHTQRTNTKKTQDYRSTTTVNNDNVF